MTYHTLGAQSNACAELVTSSTDKLREKLACVWQETSSPPEQKFQRETFDTTHCQWYLSYNSCSACDVQLMTNVNDETRLERKQ